MNKLLFKIFFCCFLSLIFSCDNKEILPYNLESDRAYFPLQTKNYIVYKVQETDYSVIKGDTTFEYYLKELISDSLIDGSNNFTYVINRYKKNLVSEPWSLDSIWTARYQGEQAIKIENNIPFVKLVFPLVDGKEWNGNAYNIKGKEVYNISSLHKAWETSNLIFDSTLLLTQKRDSSSIAQDYRSEVYAKGVGMIYKKARITSNLQKDGAIEFPIKIASGIDITQTIIEYGKE